MNAPFPEIPAFLDRRSPKAGKPLVYSYSMLNCYENVCPHQFFRRYIVKDVPFVGSPDVDHGNDGHKAMELRVSGGKPLPLAFEAMEPIATTFQNRGAKAEQQMGLTAGGQATGFWDANCWYRGKVDVTIIVNDVGYIPDYKFGKTIREDPLELELNAFLVQAKNPHLKKIVGQYVWGPDRFGIRTTPVMGPMHEVSNTLQAWKTIQRVAALIESDKRAGEFEKRKSGLCGWCDCLDCEHNGKKARLAKEGISQ